MWKILVFIEKWLMYPIMFTLCFVIYYALYVFFTFELPDINYRKKYRGGFHKDCDMSDTAHMLSAYIGALGLAIFIVFKFFLK